MGDGRHAEDLWAIKYLRGFEWKHLTEKKAYDARVRDEKLRVEFSASQKANAEFAALVDRRDAAAAIKKRKRARGDAND